MPPGYFILLLCFLGGSYVQAKKSRGDAADNEWLRSRGDAPDNEWLRSNTMSREAGEPHAAPKYSDLIDIDNDQGWDLEERERWAADIGSGYGGSNMSPDDEYSGWGYDDGEDDDEDDFPDHMASGEREPGLGAGMTPRPESPSPAWGQTPRVTPDFDIDNGAGGDKGTDTDDFEIKPMPENGEEPVDDKQTPDPHDPQRDSLSSSIIGTPGLLPGIIAGAVVGLLCAVLLVMFIVYRMRKKDEGSYALEEPKMTSPSRGYTRAPTKEYWA